jgi:hypothetical protein
VRLRGSRENLKRVVEKFTKDREIELLPWRPEGGWPVPLTKIAGEKLLDKYAGMGKVIKRLKGIEGGEVVPHFHLENDVVLLEREVFKEMVGEIAMKLGTELAGRVDYDKTVDIMSQFAIETIPLPE